jgi:hypothetical protein
LILATTNDVDFLLVDQPFTFSSSNWQHYIGAGLALPSSSNLSLYISKAPGMTAPIDVFVDDIRLEAVAKVPEPSSFALTSVCSVTTTLVSRRRRQNSVVDKTR